MACIEDNMDLIYAFSYSHSKGSVVTFLILDKIANE